MKTKFDRFKLNESYMNEKLNVNKYRGEISNKIWQIISDYTDIPNDFLTGVDIDTLLECDEIYDMTEEIVDNIIEKLQNNIPKFQYGCYDYQKYVLDKIINDEIALDLKEFLEELEEHGTMLDKQIRKEYDHILNANNMGLL